MKLFPDQPLADTDRVLIPVLALGLALCFGGLYEYTSLSRSAAELANARTQQEQLVRQAETARSQFSALALGIRRLADGGNENAQQLLAGMQRIYNISVEAPAADAPAPAATPTPAEPANPDNRG